MLFTIKSAQLSLLSIKDKILSVPILMVPKSIVVVESATLPERQIYSVSPKFELKVVSITVPSESFAPYIWKLYSPSSSFGLASDMVNKPCHKVFVIHPCPSDGTLNPKGLLNPNLTVGDRVWSICSFKINF